MKTTFRLLFLLPLFVLLASLSRGILAETLPLTELAKPGRVLMLRHAQAPGVGDPPGFRLDDCATQRNLDDSGRRQARALGSRLANAGVATARVYSSQWCRCLETARLLQLGPVSELPALNSFFERSQDRDATSCRAALLPGQLAARWPARRAGHPPVHHQRLHQRRHTLGRRQHLPA